MAKRRTIKIDVIGDVGSAKRALGSLNVSLDKMGLSVGKLAGAAGIAALGTALIRGGKAAVQMAISFESSMAKIIGLVGVSREQVEAWKDDIKDLAGETSKAPQELADAMFFITSAGLRGTTALDTLRASAMAAAAGLGETKDVAFAAVSALNAYGEENLSASQAVNILVNTVRQGNVEASEVASVIGRIIPIAAEMGVSFDQLGASIAAMTRLGSTAADSVTNLTGIFRALIKPSGDAEKVLAEYGLSALGLRRQLREEGLLSVLNTLSAVFAENEEAATKVFGRIQGLTGFLQLMGSNAATNVEIFHSLATETDVLGEAFGVAAETTEFKMNQALAEFKTIAIEVGEKVLPALVETFTDLAPALEEILPKLGELVGEIIDLANEAIPLLEVALDSLAAALNIVIFPLKVLNAIFGEKVHTAITDTSAALDNFKNQVLAGGDPVAAMARVLTGMASAGTLTAEILELLRVQSGLTTAEFDAAKTKTLELAAGTDDHAKTLVNLHAAFGIAADGTVDYTIDLEDARDAQADLGDATDGTTDALGDQEDQTDDAADATKTLTERLDEAREKQESLTEVMRSAADPVFNAVHALQSYTEKLEDAREDGKITAEEFVKLMEAGFDLSVAFEELDPAAVQEAFNAISEASGLPISAFKDVLAEFGIFVDEAGNVSVAFQDGLVQDFVGFGNRLGSQVTDEIDDAIDHIRGKYDISSPSGVWADSIGRPLSEGVAQGVLDGMEDAESAVRELMDRLQDEAEEGLGEVFDAIDSIISKSSARARLGREEEKLAELFTRRGALPALIAEANERAQVSEDEQAALEELNELKLEAAGIDDEIAAAELDVVAAQLRLIESEKNLIETGNDLIGNTEESLNAFIALAESVGLTSAEIEVLIAIMQDAQAQAEAFNIITLTAPEITTTTASKTSATSSGDKDFADLFGNTGSTSTSTTTTTDFDFTTVPVPILGSGGIVKEPTLGIIGEAGVKEAVIPLDERGINFLVEALRRAGVGGQTSTTPQTIILQVGEREMLRWIEDATRQARRAS